jgi:hypothetical protein
MHKHTLCFLGVFLSIIQLVAAQENHGEQVGAAADTIPFELTAHNNISIKATLNEADTLHLMFHTAASSLTLIREVAEKLTSIHWNRSDKVESWGGESEARFSADNSLQIGAFRWDSLAIWENENSGPGTDGKFGPDLFEGKVMEIDFDNRMLIIHEALPEKTGEFEKLPLVFESGFMFIEGSSRVGGKDYANRFLIHSGYGGTILYDDQFVENSKIGEQIAITAEQELKDSYGNILKTKKGTLPRFAIGKVVFKDISVGFFEGAIGRQKMSVMGGDLLKRFNLIIDSDRKNIYLKSNH